MVLDRIAQLEDFMELGIHHEEDAKNIKAVIVLYKQYRLTLTFTSTAYLFNGKLKLGLIESAVKSIGLLCY